MARLKDRLPAKYDPRNEKQASYLNYHTPGDEPGLGLRFQGLITWIIQTLGLTTACVLAAGIILALIGGIEALMLHPWVNGNGILGSLGISPKIPEQQSRFVTMIDMLTFLPATVWSALQAVPGLSSLLGEPAVRLGSLPNAGAIAEYVPLALVNAVAKIMFGLLPSVLVALVVGVALSKWLRNNYFVGFGSERFAWTLANRIAVVRRAGADSMLRQITISPEAWWKRDIAHCFYYKSDAVTKDVASQIAHPEYFKPDEQGVAVEHIVSSTLRWAIVALFVLGIFSMAVPIAQRQHAAAIAAVPVVLTAEKERALKRGASFQECEDGCPMMVVVPAGEFMMGAAEGVGKDTERPRRKVTIAKPFAVSRYEVMGGDFQHCVADNVCPATEDYFTAGGRPATHMSWTEADQFAQWLSKKTGKTYRLLSEAEWEYAARAGTSTAYSWGSEVGKGNANCKECGSEWDGKGKAPASNSFKPNAFGLYHMHGNVAEWVADPVHDNYVGAPADGSVWRDGGDVSRRMIRGGSSGDAPDAIRSAARIANAVGARNNVLGFRLARDLAQ